MASSSPVIPPVDASTDSHWHGYLLAGIQLPLPQCVTRSNDLARPDYTKVKSAEYIDSPDVLEIKAATLIKMWTAATHPLVYAGAGISTSSGIWDYASNAAGSVVQAKKRSLTHSFVLSLEPTPAHRVLTAMEQRGMIWGWLQQNHDGLAQKAGFPAHKVNELHGAWLDSKANPVIKMSGSLRGDLFNWMLAMEEGCDFVFGVGTSFSGLNADRCAATCAARHLSREKRGQGLAILSIQQTPQDSVAALRIFAKIDDFMLIVARQLGLGPLDKKVHVYHPAPLPVGVVDDKVWLAERRDKIAAAASASKPAAAPPKAKSPESKKESDAVVLPPVRKSVASTTGTVAAKARTASKVRAVVP